MTVRGKTLLIIAIAFSGLVIVLSGASRSFLLGGFMKFEQASARENVQTVLNPRDQGLAEKDRYTYDHPAAGEADKSIVGHATESIHDGLCQDGAKKPAVPSSTGSLYKSISYSVILRRSKAFVYRRNSGSYGPAIITAGIRRDRCKSMMPISPDS
jgi:hypothetical protein